MRKELRICESGGPLAPCVDKAGCLFSQCRFVAMCERLSALKTSRVANEPAPKVHGGEKVGAR